MEKKYKGENEMTNIKTMTSRELSEKIIENRVALRSTKDADTNRKLIAANHEMMTELDRRSAR